MNEGVHDAVHVRLLNGFDVHWGDRRVELASRESRLVVLLALQSAPRDRSSVAGRLWPDVGEQQAQSSLRSALSRIRRACPALVDDLGNRLCLARHVTVDSRRLARWARDVLDPATGADRRIPAEDHLYGILLPDWTDEWTVTDREDLRRRQVHALEVVSARLLDSGRPGDASVVAQAATRIDPLRESARRAVVRAHLADGNLATAVGEYHAYRDLLDHELGIRPSRQLTALLDDLYDRAPEPGHGSMRTATCSLSSV